MQTLSVDSVRRELKRRWLESDIVHGRGGDTVEIVGASFTADEPSIFGKPNEQYIERELGWYVSQSRNLNDFPGGAPSVWLACAAPDGAVNSNYGWCLYSEENGSQYRNVAAELCRNPASRRAIAIYIRPSMHTDAVEDGKQDFICTNAVMYFLRQGRLHCVVQMRSSDAVLGYRNDLTWHRFVLAQLASELRTSVGDIHWQAGSLHVYERHFNLLEAI